MRLRWWRWGCRPRAKLRRCAEIAAPDWGVVTNVGNAHAEDFADGIAGVARAKYELVAGCRRRRGSVRRLPECGRCLRFAVRRATFRGVPSTMRRNLSPRQSQISALKRLKNWGRPDRGFASSTPTMGPQSVQLALLGRHNISNALAAIAVGLQAGIPLARCVAAIALLKPEDKRGELIECAWRHHHQ